ncbi:MAG: hypothetical protein AAGJ81_12720 [Verrucomicrobiota bacterium]
MSEPRKIKNPENYILSITVTIFEASSHVFAPSVTHVLVVFLSSFLQPPQRIHLVTVPAEVLVDGSVAVFASAKTLERRQ